MKDVRITVTASTLDEIYMSDRPDIAIIRFPMFLGTFVHLEQAIQKK